MDEEFKFGEFFEEEEEKPEEIDLDDYEDGDPDAEEDWADD